MGKVRKGGGGRAGEMPNRSKRKRQRPAGKVLYCEGCGTTNHNSIKEVGHCHGGMFVVEGRHWRWVTR